MRRLAFAAIAIAACTTGASGPSVDAGIDAGSDCVAYHCHEQSTCDGATRDSYDVYFTVPGPQGEADVQAWEASWIAQCRAACDTSATCTIVSCRAETCDQPSWVTGGAR